MDSQRIGIIVFGLIGVGAAVASALFLRSYSVFFSRAVETRATVMSVQRLTDERGEHFDVTNYRFEYEDGGVRHGRLNEYVSGDTFTLWYDPDDVTEVRRSRVPFAAGIFAVFALGFGGIALSQALKKKS